MGLYVSRMSQHCADVILDGQFDMSDDDNEKHEHAAEPIKLEVSKSDETFGSEDFE